MIIESGIDVVQVLRGSLGFDDPRGLWIIAMDEGLRLLYVEPVVTELDGAVDDYVDDIDAFLDGERSIEYFALAWSTDQQREREPGWLRALDDRLRERLALRGRRLLGQLVFDPLTMFASVPSCDFSLEPDLADLPRAMSILGPHGLDCGCPPCRADRRAYDESYDDDYGYDETELGTAEPGYDDAPPWSPPPSQRYPRVRLPTRVGERSRRSRALERVGGYGEEPDPYDEPQYDPVWKRWYPDPPRAYKRWTFDEEVAIARSHFAGLSCFDISLLVERQPTAIASRLNKLGISSSTVVVEAAPPSLDPPPPDR